MNYAEWQGWKFRVTVGSTGACEDRGGWPNYWDMEVISIRAENEHTGQVLLTAGHSRKGCEESMEDLLLLAEMGAK